MRTAGRSSRLPMRLAGIGLAITAFMSSVGASAPAHVLPRIVRDFTDEGGGSSTGGGGGGTFLSDFGPLLLIALAIAVVVLLAAVVILVRSRSAFAPPSSSEGWWTCSNCGAGNMDGAARCHACSAWRSATPRPTPNT